MELLIGIALGVVMVVGFLVVRRARQGVVHVNAVAPAASPGDIEGQVAAGDLIGAIKAYRTKHKVGLKEAKDAVEALARGEPLPVPISSLSASEPMDAETEELIRAGRTLDAIKAYRAKTGVGLKEAKDAVEDWRRRLVSSPGGS